jgi:wyosine [tRNA(Phe)-imidazoG37] synthetase (radical SAM superfamily)
VPDGEPTLDINLGREIELLKQLGIKIAVITNSSLMWQEGVREVLAKADWASLKADAVRESIWRRIDRPHGTLQILSQRVGQVEYLIGYEGNAFAFTGDVEQDLLSITAVHPVREDAVDEFLARAQSKQGAEADWEVVRRLMARGQLVEVKYEGHRFYLRRLGRHKDRD